MVEELLQAAGAGPQPGAPLQGKAGPGPARAWLALAHLCRGLAMAGEAAAAQAILEGSAGRLAAACAAHSPAAQGAGQQGLGAGQSSQPHVLDTGSRGAQQGPHPLSQPPAALEASSKRAPQTQLTADVQETARVFEVALAGTDCPLALSKASHHTLRLLWQQRLFTAALQAVSSAAEGVRSRQHPGPHAEAGEPQQSHPDGKIQMAGHQQQGLLPLLLGVAFLVKGSPPGVLKPATQALLPWLLEALLELPAACLCGAGDVAGLLQALLLALSQVLTDPAGESGTGLRCCCSLMKQHTVALTSVLRCLLLQDTGCASAAAAPSTSSSSPSAADSSCTAPPDCTA